MNFIKDFFNKNKLNYLSIKKTYYTFAPRIIENRKAY